MSTKVVETKVRVVTCKKCKALTNTDVAVAKCHQCGSKELKEELGQNNVP